jgi:predicted mannosyl-3-phosphoglycerate phosphatase (HAD superfamily)
MANMGEIMTTEVKEKRKRGLSAYEQETIINFNKEESIAYIFTYEKTWQRHLERRLGLKPTINNGHGGKEYQLPKGLIPMPRAKRRYSEQTKKKMAARLASVRGKQHSLL